MVRLSRAAALPAQVANLPEPPGDWGQTDDDAALDHWMSHAAERLDLEVEQTEVTVAGFDTAVRRLGPAILKIETQARLLLGALRLNPDRIRHMGAGQFIGTLIESEAVEAFFLNGGFFLMVLSVIKLVFAIGIAPTVGLFYFSVLAGYLAVTALVIWLYCRRCRSWTHARLQMTR